MICDICAGTKGLRTLQLTPQYVEAYGDEGSHFMDLCTPCREALKQVNLEVLEDRRELRTEGS